MVMMALSSAGLVLRKKSVELVRAQWTPAGLQLGAFTSVAIEHPEKDADITRAIQAAIAQAKVPAGQLGLSIASPDVLLRAFTLPPLPKGEWPSAVQFEARKHIPFRPEELVWDFHVTEQRSPKQLDVVFVALRLDTFARLHECVRAAGVNPAWIESQSVSLARLVAPAKGRDNQYVGVVDIDQDGAHIVIVRDQVPYFTRDVSLVVPPAPTKREPALRPGPGAGLQVALGVPEPVPPSTGASGAPDPRAEVLFNELRVSLDFFTRENPSSSVSALWLFGPDELVGSWASWMAPQLNTTVQPGVVPMVKHAQVPAAGMRAGCSAGLVLRQLKPSRVKLSLIDRRSPSGAAAAKPRNLLESLTSFKIEATTGRPATKPLMIQIVVAFVLLALFKGMASQRVVAAKAAQVQVIGAFPDVGWGLKHKTRDELLMIKDQTLRRMAFLRRMTQQRLSATQKLNELAKSLSEGIWLESVSFSNHMDHEQTMTQASLQIQGACFLGNPEQELVAISDFAARLKENAGFLQGFQSARVGEIVSSTDVASQAAYKTFRLDCAMGRP